jgi:hypothetical protein
VGGGGGGGGGCSLVGGGSVVGGGAGRVVAGLVGVLDVLGRDVEGRVVTGVAAWVPGVVAAGLAGGSAATGGVVVGGSFGTGSREARPACEGACRLVPGAAAALLAPGAGWWERVEATAALAVAAPTDNAAVAVPMATVARRRRAGVPAGSPPRGGRCAADGTRSTLPSRIASRGGAAIRTRR